MINKNRLIKLIQQLIRIDSQNPPGEEFRIAGFVAGYFRNLGLKPRIYEFKKGRSNVVAVIEGRNSKHSLLITPHLDTVPAGKNWAFNPFSAKICKEKLYGLGATDCKCNLACGMEAINSLLEDKTALNYNLVFAATADEECGSGLGLIPLLDRNILRPDAAVVLDADDFAIIVTQKGLIHLKVRLKGKRAHGAYPWQGVNAVDIALDAIKELKTIKWRFAKNKFLNPPTLNIGTIRGGDKVNIVADWCEFELDFRFLPGMSAKTILQVIKGVIGKHAQRFYHRSAVPQAVNIEIEGIQEPYCIDHGHPLVSYLKQAMHKIKIRPIVKGSEGATTITFFQDKLIPAVATGFGSESCAHVANEYAKINNLYRGALVLESFLKNYRFDNAV